MYSRILVGTDGSETAAEAVRQAAELARLLGAELLLLHGAKTTSSAPDVGFAVPALDVEAIRSAGQEILREAAAGAGSDVKVKTLMREGDPAETILDAAEEEAVDLIVEGHRGMRGAKRVLLG